MKYDASSRAGVTSCCRFARNKKVQFAVLWCGVRGVAVQRDAPRCKLAYLMCVGTIHWMLLDCCFDLEFVFP